MAKPLTEGEIEKAWQKARPIPGRDPGLFRIAPDIIQSVIRRDRFNQCGDYGWRIEHDRPVSYRDQSIFTALTRVQRELAAAQWPPEPAGTARGKRN